MSYLLRAPANTTDPAYAKEFINQGTTYTRQVKASRVWAGLPARVQIGCRRQGKSLIISTQQVAMLIE